MRWLEWLISVLVWLSADPVEFDRQAPRAAAAVAAARASMTADDPAPPAPRPECVCGKTCVNGYWKPDGKILQRCECTCDRCKSRPAAPCPDGKCPPR